MKKRNLKSILSIASVLMLCLFCMSGCSGNPTDTTTPDSSSENVDGGVLYLKVNPEIAITYDSEGNVVKVDAQNSDADAILANYTGYEGKECKTVVSELVNAIGKAGYFVEEVEGESRQITIEIEAGSKLPNSTFLDDVAEEVRLCVSNNSWHSPVDVVGESDYGITNYVDTDYGENNDGVTDYNDTDYGPNNDGVTDYNDTDYGPNNDGVTDYNDTDYGPNNDGVTDYNDTDYGPNNDGVTDYNDTDYGPNNDGVTDYNDTDYGPNNDGVTDYDDGNSNYDDGNSNYDDGSSDYDD